MQKLPQRKAQGGVVLLEALIAVFIFSFGILGLIGMFAASIKNGTEAQSRSQAAFLADSLLGQMRVADPNTRSTSYASPSGTDYATWIANSVYKVLPTAQSSAPTVAFSGNGSRTVTITIAWKANNDSTTHQYIATSVLEAPPPSASSSP
jgi:type IV pilus assembly protein PilV